jgi:hypothetical protein
MTEKILAAARDASEAAIRRAEQTGTRIILWRDGQIVYLSAAQARAEFEANLKSAESERGTRADDSSTEK